MESEKPYSLIEYLGLFIKYKKFIIVFCLIIGTITGLYVFLIADPIFYSTSTLKSASKIGGLSGLLSSGSLSDLGDLGDIAGGGSSAKELALYESILQSRKCIEETIIKFNLMEDYKMQYMQETYKLFKENTMVIEKDRMSGTLLIGIFDKDPVKAKNINEFLISKLNQINIELNVKNAKSNREFIEQRYKLVKEDLRNSEDSLKLYQDRFGIAPELKYKAVTQAEVQLEADLKTEEVKMDLLKKILSSDQSELKMQQEKINSLKKQLNDIQYSDNEEGSFHLKGSPDIIMNYFRLQRNVEIQNKILTYILPLYEQAKIEEKKEMPSVLVIDEPNVPEKRVKPKRVNSILTSLIISFVLSLVVVILYDKLKYYKSKLKNLNGLSS